MPVISVHVIISHVSSTCSKNFLRPSHYVSLAGMELPEIHLPLPPKCWNQSHVPPHQAPTFFLETESHCVALALNNIIVLMLIS